MADSSPSFRQNSPRGLRILQAVSVSHSQLRVLLRVRYVAALIILLLGVFVRVFVADVRAIVDAVVILGFAWFAIQVLFLNRAVTRAAEQVALLQESFDTFVFNIDWNRALVPDPLPEYRIETVAQKGASSPTGGAAPDLYDWYRFPARLPRPYDILWAQSQNLGWDIELRSYWIRFIWMGLIIWFAVALLLSLAWDYTVYQALFRLLVPSAPALQVAAVSVSAHAHTVGARRRGLRTVLDALGEYRRTGKVSETAGLLCRQIQDVVWMTRSRSSRVPELVFRRQRPKIDAVYRSLTDSFDDTPLL